MPRIRDIEAHLDQIKSAEPGLNSPQIDLIREIIYLRRRINTLEHLPRFRALLEEGGLELLESFSTRWLISIADTFADFGSTVERGNAMIVTVLANVSRMAETERLYVCDSRIDEQRRESFVMPGVPLWDGMESYAIRHGDMPINMWTRIRDILATTPVILAIFELVFQRLVQNDTFVGRLAELNPNFRQLVSPFPYWELVDGCAS